MGGAPAERPLPVLFFRGFKMARIETALFDIGRLDVLSNQTSPVHRLDPRVKLLTTAAFVVTVVSFGKYEVGALIPLILFPVALISAGNLPAGYLLKKMLLVAPFAFVVAVFNPLFDRAVLVHLGPLAVSGGWVSFVSIMLRFGLTVSAALILIASTGFVGVCMALEKVGAPRIFAVQLLFLYRYIFVLIEEAARMTRARGLRSFNGRGKGMKVFGYMIGQLLLRTLDRAQRVHRAMVCRGFDGEIRLLRPLKIGGAEVRFFLFWCGFFLLVRFYNLPQLLGGFFTGLIR